MKARLTVASQGVRLASAVSSHTSFVSSRAVVQSGVITNALQHCTRAYFGRAGGVRAGRMCECVSLGHLQKRVV